VIREPGLPGVASFGFKAIDEIDDIVEVADRTSLVCSGLEPDAAIRLEWKLRSLHRNV
jgi:hypothetical protein